MCRNIWERERKRAGGRGWRERSPHTQLHPCSITVIWLTWAGCRAREWRRAAVWGRRRRRKGGGGGIPALGYHSSYLWLRYEKTGLMCGSPWSAGGGGPVKVAVWRRPHVKHGRSKSPISIWWRHGTTPLEVVRAHNLQSTRLFINFTEKLSPVEVTEASTPPSHPPSTRPTFPYLPVVLKMQTQRKLDAALDLVSAWFAASPAGKSVRHESWSGLDLLWQASCLHSFTSLCLWSLQLRGKQGCQGESGRLSLS